MSHAPSYVWALAVSAAIGIPGMTAFVIGRHNRKAAVVMAAVTAAWIATSAALAATGLYEHGARHAAPWFGLAFSAALGGALIASRLPSVRRLVSTPGMASRLVLPHTLRIEGIVFLLLMAQGHLPAVFALPAGLGDIAAGISAPFIARRTTKRSASIRFHLLGIADLVIALSIGFLAGLGPVQVFHGTASTLPLSQLPLALIVTVAVPTALTLHVISLTQLRRHAPVPIQQKDTTAAADRVAA
jgi:hypothetical protein